MQKLLSPLVWGLLLANLTGGLAVDADRQVTDGLLGLLGPFAVLGAVTFLALFVLHGATFLALRTTGPVHERAARTALRAGAAAVPLAAALVAWTAVRDATTATTIVAAVAIVALVVAVVAAARGRDGLAFAGTAVGVGAVVSTLFVALFPEVVPSTLDPAWSLTTENAASTPYTLTIMSWAAVGITPFVLGYQGWTYWVFRRRVRTGPVTTGAVDAP